MDPLRVGKSRNHRERKNGAAREAWQKRKAAANTARGPQGLVVISNYPDAYKSEFRRAK